MGDSRVQQFVPVKYDGTDISTKIPNTPIKVDRLKPTINTETLAANKNIVTTDYIAQWLDPGGSDRDVTLPAEASSTNLLFVILNTANGAGEDLVVKNDTPATIATLGPGMSGIFSCDGTNWKWEDETGMYYDKIAGGVVSPGYHTVGQEILNTTYPIYCPGNIYSGGNLMGTGILSSAANAANLPININVVGSDATDHTVCMQIDGNNIICVQATGDGAGGIVESSKKAIITSQLQGDIINNLNAQKFGADILGLITDPRFLNVQCEDPGAGILTDISTKGHDGTYTGTWTSGDRVRQGKTWVLDPDGTTAYISLGDDTDFEFDDSGAAPFTIGALVEVVAGTANQVIMAKWDSGTTLREWKLFITALEEARMSLYDESADTESFVESAVLGAGLHSIIVTYDGSGGNDADDGMNLYVDGVLDNTDKSGTVGYTAMEASATAATIGGSLNSGAIAEPFKGDYGLTFLDAVEWSAMDAWRFHQLCLAYYSEDGETL